MASRSVQERPKASIVLFKATDLRLHDHAPLRAAHDAVARDAQSFVLHLLVLDATLGFGPAALASPEAGLSRVGRLRARFVVESVAALHQALSSRGYALLVYIGGTQDAMNSVSSVCQVAGVFSHGPELCAEEQRIEGLVAARWPSRLFHGWTLTHVDDLPPSMQLGHSMPGRYKPFLDAVSRGKGPARRRPPLPEPRWTAREAPAAVREAIMAAASPAAAAGSWGLPQSADALLSSSMSGMGVGVGEDECDEGSLHRAPSPGASPVQPGGEAAALAALRAYVEDHRLRRYVGSSDSMTPGVDNALNATTRLSAYLAHGCLSARRLYEEVRLYEQRCVRNRSTYWVYHELVMRDFLAFSCLSWGRRLFSADGPCAPRSRSSRTVGVLASLSLAGARGAVPEWSAPPLPLLAPCSPRGPGIETRHCRLDASGHPWRDPRSLETRRLFDAWREGRTGYPFVDAGMRQLVADGWMPHLLRQMCAAFLVRDLRVPWRWGAEWFEQCLVDHTPDANYGNWGYRILPVPQLLAKGLATAHLTSLEILSWPVVHDPQLQYILHWLPELRPVATQRGAIYAREPWRLAAGYRREKRVDVRPRRDSPLWVMSVNRVNWPEYQQMMTGVGYTVHYAAASADEIDTAACPYPPPLVPPIELELLYDKVPVDHSWGSPADREPSKARPQPARLAATPAPVTPSATPRSAGSALTNPRQAESPRLQAPPLIQPTPPTMEALSAHDGASGDPHTTSHMIWFRKGLRVHDSPALLAARNAAAAAGVPLLAVFVIDPWFVTSGRVGHKRLQFLLEALRDLDASLRRTVGVPLLVPRGPPATVLPALWRACGVARCTWEEDTEAYAKARDARMRELGAQHGVEVHAESGHTLHVLDELLELCPERRPPAKYTDFLLLLKAAGPPRVPQPTPTALPGTCLRACVGLGPATMATMAVPSSLAEMGCTVDGTVDEDGKQAATGEALPTAAMSFELRGGESAALQRLADVVIARPAWVCAFSKPSTNPLEYAPGSTSMLSPYLKFGCLSCRTLHAALDAAVASSTRHTEPPQSLHGQLYWREFFYLLAHATPNFGAASGNPLCLHVPWREPATDAAAAAELARWADGTTGVPLVDAAMRQLKAVGWLHHLLRHVVACFLTRGQLWVHWEAGRDVFDRQLLDADWAINSANWMWLSATCFFYTYHRVYSPAHFARKYDRAGAYVRAWLPALARMPDRYIYEPWRAPIEVQRAAGCIVGRDYPAPICDPDAAASANLRRMDACYRNAPDDWKALIPPAASAEVARERNVDVRAPRRPSSFVPLARAVRGLTVERVRYEQDAPEAPEAPDVQVAEQPPPEQQPLPASTLQNGRSGGRRGRAPGRGRGRVARVQHALG